MTIPCFLGTSTLASTTLEGTYLLGHLSPRSDHELLSERASVLTVFSAPIHLPALGSTLLGALPTVIYLILTPTQ